MTLFILVAAVAAAVATPVPDYGVAEGQCRANERGPAVIATAVGLKDRKGTLRLELYSAVDGEWLADDRDLVREGKVFRRSVLTVPASGTVELCVRAPHAGDWSLALVHDRAGAKKFKLSTDGIGFSQNPRLVLSPPKAEAAEVAIGPGVTRINIVMNYRRGLLMFFGPIPSAR